LGSKGWILYKKPDTGELSTNFEKEVYDVFMAVSNLSRSIKKAIEDEKIDAQELAELKRPRGEIAKQADEVILFAENMYKKRKLFRKTDQSSCGLASSLGRADF
jgi:hypothetical protein